MSAAQSGGLLSSLRGLATTGVAILQTRLELLSVELQEEKIRVGALIAYAFAAFFFLGFGIVLLAVLLTVMLWDGQRLLPLAVFSALFLGAGAVVAGLAVSQARKSSKLFSASLAELSRDREALTPRDEQGRAD